MLKVKRQRSKVVDELISCEYASQEEIELVIDVRTWAESISLKARGIFELILANYKFDEICHRRGINDETLDELIAEIKHVGLQMEMAEYRHLMENRQPFENLLVFIDGYPPEKFKKRRTWVSRSIVFWHEVERNYFANCESEG